MSTDSDSRCTCHNTLVVKNLNRWFKEKWVDVSRKDKDGKHPPCGRGKAKLSGKGYPKCRPSVKVSGKTPKTSGSMSSGQKRSATKRKRAKKQGIGGKPTIVKSEDIDFDHIFQLLKRELSPEAQRHKKEYDTKYESSPERVKYREELNRERRRRGIYGSHNRKDVSHTQGGSLTLEGEHANRARHFKDKGTLRPIEKSFEEIAHRINAAKTHLDPEKKNVIYNRYHGEIPSKTSASDTLHPAVSQDWQPAALSALLGMVQPSAVKDYRDSIHYETRPFELGEYSDNETDE